MGSSSTRAPWISPEGGDSDTYTVALSSQPTGTVTVRVRGISGDVTVKPSQLTFTTSTWNNPQTVTVSASEDADAEEDAAVTLTHAASGGGYNGVSGGAITVTIMEDDTRGLTVTPSLLTIPEGSEDSYTVVLNTEPTRTVTVTWSNETPGSTQFASLRIAPMTLRFTQRNWNVPQRVIVRYPENSSTAGTPEEIVELGHSTNGGGYELRNVSPVLITVTDNDTDGFTITPTELEIVEGTSKTYSIVLNTRPADDVMVGVSLGLVAIRELTPLRILSRSRQATGTGHRR